MKDRLETAREIINEVDLEMIKLFKKRMAASKEVALFKKENGMVILDAKREQELIKKNKAALADKTLESYYLTFINGVLIASKEYQKDLLK